MSESLPSPYIHFHIPKTAGTSLRAIFINQFGPEHVAYMLPDRRFAKASDLPFKTEQLDKARRIARSLGLLNTFSRAVRAVDHFKVTNTFGFSEIGSYTLKLVTGHLTHDDIRDEIAYLPRTTVLRDPLERAWSHFSHWKEAKGSMWWHKGSIKYGEEITFEQFVTDSALHNYQTEIMGVHNGFHLIGTSDKLEYFLEEMGINTKLNIPVLNPGRHDGLPILDPGFLREFEKINNRDYEAYELANQQWS